MDLYVHIFHQAQGFSLDSIFNQMLARLCYFQIYQNHIYGCLELAHMANLVLFVLA